jgi:uncharacterized RDD family membrane protein YckC
MALGHNAIIMNWYYAVDEEQVGPLTEAEFNALVTEGKIKPDTKVWRDGMAEWASYADLAYVPGAPAAATLAPLPMAGPAAAMTMTPATSVLTSGYHKCVECGGSFPEIEMISFDNAWVCAACKPVYVQKLKEGIAPMGTLNYAGFWIRAGAKVLDGIILWVAIFSLDMITIMVVMRSSPRAAGFVNMAINLIVGISYAVYFNGRFGATPGKMALKLKIVRPDGEAITYGRAVGRYFAEMLSSLTFFVGYMMAGWDEEKRALHDRVADTRVIQA